MKKKLILLVCLISCFLIPNVKAVDRIEDTFLWEIGYSNSHTIELFNERSGDQISWSVETYNNSFKVSVALIPYGGDLVWISELRTEDSGIETLQGDDMFFCVQRNENIEGYIKIIIENYTFSISSYSLFLILGLVGLTIIIKIKRCNNNG